MPELTTEDIKAIRETHDTVIKVKTILDDGSGGGLCNDVRDHQRRIGRLELIFAYVLGTGILGGGLFGLIKLLS